ncbi:protein of unknown function [Clostridium beijerinckii]|nr:protein of unknown function [Clostridium beijerinckii]
MNLLFFECDLSNHAFYENKTFKFYSDFYRHVYYESMHTLDGYAFFVTLKYNIF